MLGEDADDDDDQERWTKARWRSHKTTTWIFPQGLKGRFTRLSLMKNYKMNKKNTMFIQNTLPLERKKNENDSKSHEC